MGLVIDEASALVTDETGNTVYDAGFPIPMAYFHPTDNATESNSKPGDIVEWTDLDYEIGGSAGLVDRNAYILGGITNYTDAHDFRGDVVPVEIRGAGGSMGDVGYDDYSNQYANAIAAQGYPDTSREQSWDEVSAAY